MRQVQIAFEFERADLQDFDFSVNDWTRDKPDFLTLDEFVARHPVRSFLVIQNDSIKYEYYRKDLDTLDLNPPTQWQNHSFQLYWV